MCRSYLRGALASGMLVLGVGCSSTFPPVIAAPGPAEARGIRVLLYQDDGPTGGKREALEHGLADALRAAGFEVIDLPHAEGHQETMPPRPYDFALAYGVAMGKPDGTGYTSLHIALRVVARDIDESDFGVNWEGSGWAARNAGATDGSVRAGRALPRELKACVQSWETTSVGIQNAKLGSLAPANGEGVAVWSPNEADEAPGTRARVATFLVNQLVDCPGFVSFLHTVRSSGLAADAPMQDLPVSALKNLCRASVGPRGHALTAATGSLKSLEDTCALALSKDRTLASFVQEIESERKGTIHEYVEGQRERARSPSRDDDDAPRRSSGAAQPAGGSNGVGAGLDAAGRDIAAGIQQIEQQKRQDAELRRKLEACTKAREQGRPCN